MKYTYRENMFETNSSSTHSLTIKYEDREYKDERNEAQKLWDDFDRPETRFIKSKKMKGLFLLQQYHLHQRNNDKYLEFKNYLLPKMGELDDLAKNVIRIIEKKDSPCSTPACDVCTCNGPLDWCNCGLETYMDIAKALNINVRTKDSYKKVIDAMMDDKLYIELKEYWMGGDSFDIDTIL